jgi:hypothetical protein
VKIDNDAYYAIISKDGSNVYEWFNDRVYLGRWVMSAYNQIKDKDKYKIYLISNVLEVNNE